MTNRDFQHSRPLDVHRWSEFAIVGVVSVSKAEAQNQLKAVNADELLYAKKNGAILIDIRVETDKRKFICSKRQKNSNVLSADAIILSVTLS